MDASKKQHQNDHVKVRLYVAHLANTSRFYINRAQLNATSVQVDLIGQL